MQSCRDALVTNRDLDRTASWQHLMKVRSRDDRQP